MDANVAAVFVILFALWWLGAMLRREWVKADLHANGCQPISIWWVPLACWAPGWPRFTGPAFRVTYADPTGLVHKAYCWTSNLRPRHVVWVKDRPEGELTSARPVKPQRRWKPIIVAGLVNVLPLALIAYGLKCIVALSGQSLVPRRYAARAFEFSPVEGQAAALTGLSYAAFGIFVYLSANIPRDGRSKLWCFARSVIRWGCFVGMIWLYDRARNM